MSKSMSAMPQHKRMAMGEKVGLKKGGKVPGMKKDIKPVKKLQSRADNVKTGG